MTAPAGRAGTALVKARITPVAGGGGAVIFQFNPGKVSLSKQAKTEGSRGVVANSYEEAVKASGNLTIKLGEIKLVGSRVKATVDQLLRWTVPLAGAARGGGSGNGQVSRAGGLSGGGLGAGAAQSQSTTKGMAGATTAIGGAGRPGGGAGSTAYKLPVLMFSWGGGGGVGGGSSGLSYKVTLEQVDANFERFTGQGVPVLATASLTLKEYTEPIGSTNPTSGGLPGRGKHTVIVGDSIVRIANDFYDDPHAWRAVAEANGIDDPLRIKPGQQLYLPSSSELDEVVQQ